MAIEVNHKYNSIYATGVDSRVLNISQTIDEDTKAEDWILSSIFRG